MSHSFPKPIQQPGDRFGLLVLVAEGERDKWARRQWKCRCDCGAERLITENRLRSGGARSCGCTIRGPRGAKTALRAIETRRERVRPGDPKFMLERIDAAIAVDPATGCHNWTRNLDKDGYGRFVAARHFYRAHRVNYELRVGPVSPSLHLDHLCRNRRCVNPAHLEPVTPRENDRRARAWREANP